MLNQLPEVEGVRALAETGPVLALVPPLAKAIANASKWPPIFEVGGL
jgi:hypothetical protein